MKMTSITRGNASPQGKRHLFIHAAASDAALRGALARRILAYGSGLDYALWYAEDPEAVFDELESEDLLSMLVFIPLVTPSYLALCAQHGAGRDADGVSLLDRIQARGIAVLPLIETTSAIGEFTRLFGNTHAIFLCNDDADRLIEEQLDHFLPDGELLDDVERDAFSSSLFLSYRKKDKDEAARIMRAIHDTDIARRTSIWFDELLVSGRDFDEEILEHLRDSDAMALAVTPHLLEEGNYVLTREYPSALEEGKEVVPIEAVRTAPDELSRAYPGIARPADVRDTQAIEAQLEAAGLRRPDVLEPYEEYLLGMAFLYRIHVEKDEQRAVRLLESSAERDCVEACEQLGFLYLSGIAVGRDHSRSIAYKQRAYDLIRRGFGTPLRAQRLYGLLYGSDGLCLMLKSLGRGEEAGTISRDFLAYLDDVRIEEGGDVLYRANALCELADLHFDEFRDAGERQRRIAEALESARKALDLLEGYDGDEPDEASFQRSVALSLLSNAHRLDGNDQKAIELANESLTAIKDLERRTGRIDHKEQARNTSMYRGVLLRDVALEELRRSRNPMRTFELTYPPTLELAQTIARSRELMELAPTISNREGMALSLYNFSLIASTGKLKKACRAEAYAEIVKLYKETADGSFDDEMMMLGKAVGFLQRRSIEAGKEVPHVPAEAIQAEVDLQQDMWRQAMQRR